MTTQDTRACDTTALAEAVRSWGLLHKAGLRTLTVLCFAA